MHFNQKRFLWLCERICSRTFNSDLKEKWKVSAIGNQPIVIGEAACRKPQPLQETKSLRTSTLVVSRAQPFLPQTREEYVVLLTSLGRFILAIFAAISSAIFFFWRMWTSEWIMMFRWRYINSDHSLTRSHASKEDENRTRNRRENCNYKPAFKLRLHVRFFTRAGNATGQLWSRCWPKRSGNTCNDFSSGKTSAKPEFYISRVNSWFLDKIYRS